MIFLLRWTLLVAAAMTTACMATVRAEDVVRVKMIQDTDCADFEVTRSVNGGLYEVRGCGKVRTYVCDRPTGVGATKPAAIEQVNCVVKAE